MLTPWLLQGRPQIHRPALDSLLESVGLEAFLISSRRQMQGACRVEDHVVMVGQACAKWLDKEELFGYEISRNFLQPLETSGSLVCGLT
jgi:hypothetical protein